MPFFATRRIVEGLGLGLARRAARKLVPVVLTLGSGPSGFPRKLSGRRPKLPRQPRRTTFRATAEASATASLALASVVSALGVGPTGFPKQVSERCKAGGSWTPTAMANPRRRTRALRYFGAGGWPVGLPETIFRARLP